jgi:hypothetical protein
MSSAFELVEDAENNRQPLEDGKRVRLGSRALQILIFLAESRAAHQCRSEFPGFNPKLIGHPHQIHDGACSHLSHYLAAVDFHGHLA